MKTGTTHRREATCYRAEYPPEGTAATQSGNLSGGFGSTGITLSVDLGEVGMVDVVELDKGFDEGVGDDL